MSTLEDSDNQSDDRECPACGKGGFGSERAMKIHHYNAHGESLVEWQTVVCDTCGDNVEKHPSDIERYPVHYCSKECYGVATQTRKSVPCDNCGDMVVKRADQLEKYERHFCGVGCSAAWDSENREYLSGGDHPQYDRVVIECELEDCENTREEIPALAEQARFCSRQCWGVWASENVVGPDHHRWTGFNRSYGTGWNEAKKEAVRERDGRQCRHCRRSETEHVDLYGIKQAVHHIRPADSFDDPERRNAMENLITLCVGGCHQHWERMAPLRPQTDD